MSLAKLVKHIHKTVKYCLKLSNIHRTFFTFTCLWPYIFAGTVPYVKSTLTWCVRCKILYEHRLNVLLVTRSHPPKNCLPCRNLFCKMKMYHFLFYKSYFCKREVALLSHHMYIAHTVNGQSLRSLWY